MKYKVGINNQNYCSSITGKDLKTNEVFKCENPSHTRLYEIDPMAKWTIINGLAKLNISVDSVSWIGEARTGLTNGNMLMFGYSKFIRSR